MNVRELFRLTLSHLGEETDEYTTEEFRFAMLAAMNRAYMEIMRNKRLSERRETVELQDGRFSAAALTQRCVKICAVYSGENELPFAQKENGAVAVRCAGGIVEVRYRCLPPPLKAEADIPQFPEEFHAALADYAAYTLLGGTARQPRADFFLRNYMQTYMRIPPENESTAITGKWL